MRSPLAQEVIAGLELEGNRLDVLGIIRNGAPLEDPFNHKIRTGDRMLVAGAWDDIDALVDQNHEYVLLGMPGERRQVAPAGAQFAVSSTTR